GTVAETPGRRRAEQHGHAVLDEQHAHDRGLRGAERRARVVVRQDPRRIPAVEVVAVRTPLAHPDAVAPAVTRDHERRGPGGGGGGNGKGEQRRGSGEKAPKHRGTVPTSTSGDRPHYGDLHAASFEA